MDLGDPLPLTVVAFGPGRFPRQGTLGPPQVFLPAAQSVQLPGEVREACVVRLGEDGLDPEVAGPQRGAVRQPVQEFRREVPGLDGLPRLERQGFFPHRIEDKASTSASPVSVLRQRAAFRRS